MPALGAGVGRDLPVVIERLTFGQGRNDHASKSNDEKPTDDLQTQFIRAFPYVAREALQEFGYSEFSDPDASQRSAMIRSFIDRVSSLTTWRT